MSAVDPEGDYRGWQVPSRPISSLRVLWPAHVIPQPADWGHQEEGRWHGYPSSRPADL